MNPTLPQLIPLTPAPSGDTLRERAGVSNSTPAPSPAGGDSVRLAVRCGWCKTFLVGNPEAGVKVTDSICPICKPKYQALMLLEMLKGHLLQAERLAGIGDRMMIYRELQTCQRQIGEIETLLKS